jgi:hypothetical protein
MRDTKRGKNGKRRGKGKLVWSGMGVGAKGVVVAGHLGP